MSDWHIEAPCISCEEGEPKHLCDNSRRSCGHHCNCWWVHDECCWCGKGVLIEEEDEK